MKTVCPVFVLMSAEWRLSPVLFTCDDIQETHQELTARGVEFPDPPGQRSWGWCATFTDNEGNLYGLGQRSTD